MKRRELRSIAKGFRNGLLEGRSSDQMCFAVAAALQGYLSAIFGYETKLVEGDFGRTNHFWLELPDGCILDPTADQFQTPAGGKMPAIYIGPKPQWYKLA